MLLAVDIGNTHTVVGLFDPATTPGDDPVADWRLRSAATTTEDELAASLMALLQLRSLGLGDVRRVVVSSVVPALSGAWQRLAARYVPVADVTVVGTDMDSGMEVRTDHPEELGADRIANGIAGWQRYRRACIVVDMGTATTFDAIAADGAYLGGAIAPGLGISLDALVGRAARLASVELAVPPRAIGTNTVASVQSGTLLGTASMLAGMIERFRAELADEAGGRDIPAIATGGLAPLVDGLVPGLDAVDPWLTLRGLHHIAARGA